MTDQLSTLYEACMDTYSTVRATVLAERSFQLPPRRAKNTAALLTVRSRSIADGMNRKRMRWLMREQA
jgi:hypothetical protein